jgi:peptide/nickel transport system substrate-binding protein
MLEEAMRIVTALALLAGLSASASALPLTVGIGDAPTSIDPHYLNSPTNKNVICNVFDALTDADNTIGIVPSLAESWRLVNDTTWEFKLRPGVRFHDGTPLTAEDVRASYLRVPKVPNAPQPFTTYIRLVKEIRVIDPNTVHMITEGLDPILPNEAVQIRIIQASKAESSTDDFNTGKAATGTGPMRFVSFQPGIGIELARNDAYWGRKPAWDKVSFRIISDGASRVAALLAGDVQIVDLVPSDLLSQLRSNDKIRVASAELGLRYIFLALDQSRDGPTPFVAGPNGEMLDKNPLKDVRVRRALSIAINRPAIVERVMEGVATATGQMMPEGGFGWTPAIKIPAFDPDLAKKLLAEAGYPGGLRVTIHSTKGRYVNDTRIVQAIAQMWQRIGVQTSIELQPWSTYATRVHKREYSIMIGAVAAVTTESSQVLRSAMGTYDPPSGWGGFNWGRYSNPTLDALVTRAANIADNGQRETVLRQAMVLGTNEVANIPLHLQKTTWAMQRSLTYAGRSDDQTRVADIIPASR